MGTHEHDEPEQTPEERQDTIDANEGIGTGPHLTVAPVTRSNLNDTLNGSTGADLPLTVEQLKERGYEAKTVPGSAEVKIPKDANLD